MKISISRRNIVIAGCLASIAAWTLPSQAAPVSFKMALTGAQQVPPVQTGANGMADLSYDPATRMLTWSVNNNRPPGRPTAKCRAREAKDRRGSRCRRRATAQKRPRQEGEAVQREVHLQGDGRDLVFGDWASAAIFLPRRVWIGEELLHHLLRCYFRAVLGERRPQSRQQLYSDAWLIWSAREVSRRPTCLFGPTATSMLRNLQQQFPISTQPIVKTWRLRWLQVLDDTDVVGSPPCELAPNR